MFTCRSTLHFQNTTTVVFFYIHLQAELPEHTGPGDVAPRLSVATKGCTLSVRQCQDARHKKMKGGSGVEKANIKKKLVDVPQICDHGCGGRGSSN